MDKTRNSHFVHFGTTDSGTFVAVSASSPYFCFEADSHEEAEDLAKRALDYYFEVSGALIEVKQPRKSESTISRVGRTTKQAIPLQHALA